MSKQPNPMHSALMVIDLQNDIIHPNGKLAGCAKMAADIRLIEHANTAIRSARRNHWPVIFIRVGFSAHYTECSTRSPLFAYVRQVQALQLNTWGAEFDKNLDIQPDDSVITKHRVGGFYATRLPAILIAQHIQHVVLCGVSTDFAVQMTAREAHDRDYQVSIVQDACAANSLEDHHNTIKLLEKFTKIINSSDL